MPSTMAGSPPPMRGKALFQLFHCFYNRITPAYAGKSQGMTSVTLPKTGSPPPMRGKAYPTHAGFVRTGITPAYAGKSG